MDKELKKLYQQADEEYLRAALASDQRRERFLKTLTPEQRRAVEEAGAICGAAMLQPLPQKVKRYVKRMEKLVDEARAAKAKKVTKAKSAKKRRPPTSHKNASPPRNRKAKKK